MFLESGLFFAFAPTKVLFSVGLVFSAIFVIFIIVILYRYAKQRKSKFMRFSIQFINYYPQCHFYTSCPIRAEIPVVDKLY